MPEVDPKSLHDTMDAAVWAKAFVERFGGDEGTVLGWFANAIMTGYDHGRRKGRECVSGALYDFAGYLTTRPQSMTLGAQHDAVPAVDALMSWAAGRSLKMDKPNIEFWAQDLGVY